MFGNRGFEHILIGMYIEKYISLNMKRKKVGDFLRIIFKAPLW
jgi:hypothetical protein